MATINVSLPDPMKKWVETEAKSGQYSDTSDYVRDLIRRDQEYRDKRELLVRALVAGEYSGPSGRTVEEIWASVKARHSANV